VHHRCACVDSRQRITFTFSPSLASHTHVNVGSRQGGSVERADDDGRRGVHPPVTTVPQARHVNNHDNDDERSRCS
jgi:hypothetical protein